MKNILKKFYYFFVLSFLFSENLDARANLNEEEFPLISDAIFSENSDFKVVSSDYAKFLTRLILENSEIAKTIRTKAIPEEQAEKIETLINGLIDKISKNKEFLELAKVAYYRQLNYLKEVKKFIQRADILEKVFTPFLFSVFVVSKFLSSYNERNKFFKYFSVFSESLIFLSIINSIKNFSKKKEIEEALKEYSFAKGPENIKMLEFVYNYLNKYKYQSEIEEILLSGIKKSEIFNENEVESNIS